MATLIRLGSVKFVLSTAPRKKQKSWILFMCHEGLKKKIEAKLICVKLNFRFFLLGCERMDVCISQGSERNSLMWGVQNPNMAN